MKGINSIYFLKYLVFVIFNNNRTSITYKISDFYFSNLLSNYNTMYT